MLMIGGIVVSKYALRQAEKRIKSLPVVLLLKCSIMKTARKIDCEIASDAIMLLKVIMPFSFKSRVNKAVAKSLAGRR